MSVYSIDVVVIYHTSLSQSRCVGEVGENVVVQPRQQDLAAGVIEATVATSLNILAHHA